MVTAVERSAVTDAAGSVHGFPAVLTSFVGRAGVVDEIAGQLGRDRLGTVTGAGGGGGTPGGGRCREDAAGRRGSQAGGGPVRRRGVAGGAGGGAGPGAGVRRGDGGAGD